MYRNINLKKGPQEFSVWNHDPAVSHLVCSMSWVCQRDFREGISAENSISDLSSSPVHLKLFFHSIKVATPL